MLPLRFYILILSILPTILVQAYSDGAPKGTVFENHQIYHISNPKVIKNETMGTMVYF